MLTPSAAFFFGNLLSERLFSWLDIDIRRRGTRWHRARKLPAVPTVVDVGIGTQGTPQLYSLFPDARFILIDPLEECREAVQGLLRDPRNVFVATALGPQSGTTTIYVDRSLSRSTLLVNYGPDAATVAERTVPIRRLDDVLAEVAPDGPVGLKVDTEGYELLVLDGAAATLARTEFAILEVNIQPRFQDSYTFEDAIAYMSDRGFTVGAMLHAGTRKCDIAFVRKRSPT